MIGDTTGMGRLWSLNGIFLNEQTADANWTGSTFFLDVMSRFFQGAFNKYEILSLWHFIKSIKRPKKIKKYNFYDNFVLKFEADEMMLKEFRSWSFGSFVSMKHEMWNLKAFSSACVLSYEKISHYNLEATLIVYSALPSVIHLFFCHSRRLTETFPLPRTSGNT